MIKISIPNIDTIARVHYKNVVVKCGKKGKAKTLVQILEQKGAGRISRKKEFFRKLKNDIELDFHNSLITAKPNILSDFINIYERDFSDVLSNKKHCEELLKIFFYEKYEKWNAYQLSEDLNVKVCPYCNRQYTFTLVKSEVKKGIRPHFDHFFDKATYPYLALSFYNLIPSCYICNSSLKGSDKFKLSTHLHPYIEGFDERIKFSIRPQNINFINGTPDAFKVKLKINRATSYSFDDLRRIRKNSKVFRLIDLYNEHKDFIAEIIQKSIAYDEDYYQSLFNEFNGTLFNSIEDVKRMVLSNYITDEKLGNRVLSKLTKDIAEELGIL